MAARAIKIRVGTSGFGYREWLGGFYPAKLAGAKMLGYYAERIATVEINLTFRRRVATATLEKWAASTPAHFRFALKAPYEITHARKLREVEQPVREFIKTAGALGERLGPILFQLPPSVKSDPALLKDFLVTVPPSTRIAFEFRHPSWFEDNILRTLTEAGAALCIAETEDLDSPVVRTAPHVYLRLRKDSYDEPALAEWARKIKGLARGADQVFAYLRHNVSAPGYATRLAELLRATPPATSG